MKKIVKLAGICLMSCLISMPVFAQGVTEDASVSRLTETFLSLNNQTTKLGGMTRGRFLSSATIQLADEGDGVLGVYANTLCHVNVKDMYIDIYLDIYNETTGKWQQLNMYEQEWHAETPEETLSMGVISFDIVGLERRRTYRLRSTHTVRTHTSSTESMSPRTSAVILR